MTSAPCATGRLEQPAAPPSAASLLEDSGVVAWRRWLHRHPETAFAEHDTGAAVATALEELGLEVTRGIGGTGVVGTLSFGALSFGATPAEPPELASPAQARSAGRPRAIAVRADLDALPIQEVEGRPHGSVRPGAMHACGHDGHMAMVLGAAARLAQLSRSQDVHADEPGSLHGLVRFIFQPAEEPGRGAAAMVADGLFDRFPVDALYGLHNLPGLPAGHLHTRAGGIMASEDNFEITITGRGGHAARPDMVVDPLVIGAEVVLALQTIVARDVDPVRSAVVSCTGFSTDGARNAIPGVVRITGDTRSFDPQVQALLERRIRQIGEGLPAAHGASGEVTYTHEFAPTVNDPGRTAIATKAARAALGDEAVDGDCSPIMPSEDFGVFATHVPACFALLGNGTEEDQGGSALHSRTYDFNDAVLEAGISFYLEVVRAELTR